MTMSTKARAIGGILSDLEEEDLLAKCANCRKTFDNENERISRIVGKYQAPQIATKYFLNLISDSGCQIGDNGNSCNELGLGNEGVGRTGAFGVTSSDLGQIGRTTPLQIFGGNNGDVSLEDTGFQEALADLEKGRLSKNFGDVGRTVTVLEVLSVIFGFPLEVDCEMGSAKNGNRCCLCERCAEILTSMFQAFQELRRLADESSYLYKNLSALHEVVTKAFSVRSENVEPKASKFVPSKRRRGRPRKVPQKAGLSPSIDELNLRGSPGPGSPVNIVKLETDSQLSVTVPAVIEDRNTPSTGTESITVAQNGRKLRTSTRIRKVRVPSDLGELPSKLNESTYQPNGPDIRDPRTKSTDKIRNLGSADVSTKLLEICGDDTYYSEINLSLASAGVYNCPDPKCQKVFKCLKYLNRHALCHDLERQYNCTKCNEVFQNRQEIVQHIKLYHADPQPGSNQVTCFSKSMKSSNGKHLWQKQLSVIRKKYLKLKNGKLECEECGKVFKHAKSLRRHISAHQKDSVQCCCMSCDMTFTSVRSLAGHIRNAHEGKGEGNSYQISCPDCGVSYEDLNKFKSHFLTEHEKQLTLNYCLTCGKSFTSPYRLSQHFKNTHTIGTIGGGYYLVKQEVDQVETNQDESKSVEFDTSEPTERDFATEENDNELTIKGPNGKLECEECGKVFQHPRSLRRHLSTHQKDAVQCCCTACDKAFTSVRCLAEHIRTVHEEADEDEKIHSIELTCPDCRASFNDLDKLKTHFETDHEKQLILNFCLTCGKAFGSQYHLRRHMENVHKIETTDEGLPEVDLVETNQNDSDNTTGLIEGVVLVNDNDHELGRPMIKLVTRPSSSKAGLFKCKHCDKVFKTKKPFDFHVLFHAETQPRFGCTRCPKRFFQGRCLKRHMLHHSAEKFHKCNICEKVFSRKDHLKRHKGQLHGVNRPKNITRTRKRREVKTVEHSCRECGKTFARKEYLKLHMRIHTGEKPFMCSICGKTFRDPRNLQQHQITHKTDRPYCCSVCGVTFKRVHHLYDHEKTHKEDVPRPFLCSIPSCGKTFKLRKHLVSHELVHSGSRDHTCHVCGKAFNRKDNLRQHITKVHGKDLATNPIRIICQHSSQNNLVGDVSTSKQGTMQSEVLHTYVPMKTENELQRSTGTVNFTTSEVTIGNVLPNILPAVTTLSSQPGTGSSFIHAIITPVTELSYGHR